MSVEQLEKENGLLREYVKTLEKQVRANSEERSALCKEMTSITHENLQLTRRVSAQPAPLAQPALHYEQRLKDESLKNVFAAQELAAARARAEALASRNAALERRIEEVERENGRMKDEARTTGELEGEVESLKRSLRKWQAQTASVDLLGKELQKEREQNQMAREEGERLAREAVHLQRQAEGLREEVRQLQEKLRQRQGELDTLRQQTATFKSTIPLLEKEKQLQQRLIEEKISAIAKMSDQIVRQSAQIKNTTEQNVHLLQQKAQMAVSLTELTDYKLKLEQENEDLTESLERAKQEVQELSGEIRQYVNEKVQQKSRKNRTENCSLKPHFEFNNAFKQLKVQIEAITNDRQQEQPTKTEGGSPLAHKQNTPFDISSPSKWKSVEGKLSLLRSTQSMSRFR